MIEAVDLGRRKPVLAAIQPRITGQSFGHSSKNGSVPPTIGDVSHVHLVEQLVHDGLFDPRRSGKGDDDTGLGARGGNSSLVRPCHAMEGQFLEVLIGDIAIRLPADSLGKAEGRVTEPIPVLDRMRR